MTLVSFQGSCYKNRSPSRGGPQKCVLGQWQSPEEISNRVGWSDLLFESVALALVWRMAWRWREGLWRGNPRTRPAEVLALFFCGAALVTSVPQGLKPKLKSDGSELIAGSSLCDPGQVTVCVSSSISVKKKNIAHLRRSLWGSVERIQVKRAGICSVLREYELWSWWGSFMPLKVIE